VSKNVEILESNETRIIYDQTLTYCAVLGLKAFLEKL